MVSHKTGGGIVQVVSLGLLILQGRVFEFHSGNCFYTAVVEKDEKPENLEKLALNGDSENSEECGCFWPNILHVYSPFVFLQM